MTDLHDEDVRDYAVVVNDEERHSIWLADRQPPAGWETTVFSGTKAQCLEHIDQIWTDMRPKSLRERMQRAEAGHGS